MVLEALINPLKAEKKPWEVFFVGAAYSSVAVFLSLWVFREHSSMIMVFLTVMASIPLVYSTIKYEEKKDLIIKNEPSLLKEHSKALFFLMFLFMGFVISFSFWYIVLPQELSSQLFSAQTSTIASINNIVVGDAVTGFGSFVKIFMNNLRVLTLSILFAFVYGLGAIFILTWNASVIGAAMGSFIKTNLAALTVLGNAPLITGHLHAISFGFLRYFIHGIPEMAAYFVGGLAGGIISIAMIRGHLYNNNFEKILFDCSELVLLSLLLLLVSGALEVYVTPLIF